MRENLEGVVRFTMMKDRSSISVQEGDKRIPWQGAGGVNRVGSFDCGWISLSGAKSGPRSG
jgi:hypothetical protein